MRAALAAFLMVTVFSGAALAAPRDKSGTTSAPESADGPRHPVLVPPPPPVPAIGVPNKPAGLPPSGVQKARGDGRPGDHDGSRDRRGERRHGDHGYGVFFPYPPFPSTWPYPAYPYSQYYYPYPPYYPNGLYDDDDAEHYSTRGLVVPGDLPTGISAYWYYCDTPDGYYPYVKSCTHEWTRIPISPPPPGTAAPVSYSDWQWCEDKKAFFPYVTSCSAGFAAIPVTAPGKEQAGPPAVANWFFCEDPRGYSPYVVQCKRDWRAVPAVPPPSVKITVKDGK